MLRSETRARARALQLLYAAETRPGERLVTLATGLARLTGPEPRVLDLAEELATGVLERHEAIDRRLAAATEHWRLERLGVMERNILRLGTLELERGDTPPRVVIDEAVRLAQWFGGARTPGFVNGVLDRIARDLGVL